MAQAFYLLTAINGEQEILIDREIIAGRDLSCDLVLVHGGASRKHAKLSPSVDGVMVEDLGSTNGVYINDERIEQATLVMPGDTIQIGDTQLELLPLEQEEEAVAAPIDPDATIMFAPPTKAAPAQTPAPTPAPAAPEPVVDNSKAPPSWVLNNQQSVDGTRLVARDQEPVAVNEKVIEKAGNVQVSEPTLMGVSEPFLGMRFQLIGDQKNQWELGRKSQSDIMVNHESVSTTHAQIIRDGVRWKIVDLMSANGTFINGKKCLTGYLENRDVIRLGSVDFVLLLDGSNPNAADIAKSNTEKPSGSKALWLIITGVVVAAAVGTAVFFGK